MQRDNETSDAVNDIQPPQGSAAAELEVPENQSGASAAAPSSDPLSAPPESRAPLVPPVIDVHDLDWERIAASVDPGGLRARMRPIVEQLETRLDSEARALLLFDEYRQNSSDRAIRLAELPHAPLWFIGDLHGDLLALETALALVQRESERERGRAARIVFLGDLFDDGGFGLETLLRVFDLMIERPHEVCLLAGNHDEALGYNGARFTATVSPADFSDFLNDNLAHEWIGRVGKLAVRIVANAPRALFFADGLLAVHGGFPLRDLHPRLAADGDWNAPDCLSDFVWTRAHPRARRKLPNRTSRGSQFGYEDFAEFCALSTTLGRPVTHMVRGHDHVDERYAVYPAYSATPVLTTVALSRRLERELFGPFVRVPSIARWVPDALPQVHRLHIPEEHVRRCYVESPAAETPTTREERRQ